MLAAGSRQLQAGSSLACCRHRTLGPPSLGQGSRSALRVQAIHIDRRQHLELAWQRQQQKEQQLSRVLSQPAPGPSEGPSVIEVHDLAQLERILDWAGNSLVVLCFYTRSCGACKSLMAYFEEMSREARAQKVRAVFVKHNIMNEFDDQTDIARWHKVKLVPSLHFFDGGAVVQRVTLRDVRRMASGPKAVIQQAMADDLALMKAVFRQMLFRTAPGARP